MSVYKWVTFRELDDDANAPSLQDSVGQLDAALVAKIVGYLKSGARGVVAEEVVEDVLDPERDMVSTDNLRTDGEWAWREDIQYYVRTYRCALPTEFVKKATRLGRVDLAAVDVEDFVAWSLTRNKERDGRLMDWLDG